jgi:plasmid stability protein
MPVSVTIRDVPDETWNELAARAARAGQSLEQYLRAQLVALVPHRRPGAAWDRVEHRVSTTGSRLSAEAILELRDADRR